MNHKVLATLSIIAVVLGILNLALLLIPNIQNYVFPSQSTLPIAGQRIQLEYRMTIKNFTANNVIEYYPVHISVFLPSEITTLFNCHIQLDYLTESGLWKTASKDIGIVNYNDVTDMRTISLSLDSDFNSGGVPISISGGISYSSLENDITSFGDPSQINIEVSTYGYLKP